MKQTEFINYCSTNTVFKQLAIIFLIVKKEKSNTRSIQTDLRITVEVASTKLMRTCVSSSVRCNV